MKVQQRNRGIRIGYSIIRAERRRVAGIVRLRRSLGSRLLDRPDASIIALHRQLQLSVRNLRQLPVPDMRSIQLHGADMAPGCSQQLPQFNPFVRAYVGSQRVVPPLFATFDLC